MDYQLAIIGAGPGGYIAALRAAQLGMKVCLVEKSEVGGVCLNQGCIPTKTLVASARFFAQVNRAGEYGIEIPTAMLNWQRVRERKEQVVQRLVKGIHHLLEQRQVELRFGTARMLSPHQLQIQSRDGLVQLYTAESIIIATGSVPMLPEVFQYDGQSVLDSTDLLELTELPESIVIIGGGVIGCEFASILNAFGVKVTLVEMVDRLLPQLDPEVSSMLRLQLKKQGIGILTSAEVKAVSKKAAEVTVELADGTKLSAAKVLVAIGRKPNSIGLGLEEVGVKVATNGRIKVNQYLQTSIESIYAVGDVNDQAWDLAHAASSQALVAVKIIRGQRSVWNDRSMPNCIFTNPEVATVGLNSLEVAKLGLATRSAKFPFLANGKALTIGEPIGFVKVIAAENTGQILGVSMIGPQVSDLISEATLAVKHGLAIAEIIDTIHAHPTLAEAFREACEGVLGLGIHV